MRSIPAVTKNLLIINILAFLAMLVGKSSLGVDLNDLFGLHFFMASNFKIYQLVTYMFMHASFEHILFNMFALWMFGCVVERVWGGQRFLFYYLCCGIGAGVLQELAQFFSIYWMFNEQVPLSILNAFTVMSQNADMLNVFTTVGASGAIYAILLAFGMIFPEERIFIFPLPIPIKAKYFVIGYAAIELFSAMSTTNDHVAHLAHLGGMLFGFLLIRYWQRNPASQSGYFEGQQFFSNMRSRWENHKVQRRGNSHKTSPVDSSNSHQKDWDFNARKRAEQAKIDEILDKIRKNGYESLTSEEKQILFDQSKR